MHFQSVSLKGFRNYRDLSVEFSRHVNILLGNNGQGKTNLIEAVYTLCLGDSFRYGDNSTLIHNEFDQAIINSVLKQNQLQYEISLQMLKTKNNFYLNGKKTPSVQLSNLFQVVLFSPESLSAIKEGDDQRRSLIDEAIVLLDRSSSKLIFDFKKALKTRNKILKNYREAVYSKQQTLLLLESINPQFIDLGTQLTIKRIKVLKNLIPEMSSIFSQISNDANVDISVNYVISSHNAINYNEQEVRDILAKRLIELHEAELSTGASLVGPHKHDITFIYNGNDSRFYCSQGQQRALIIAFKIAQIVYHRRVHERDPILMLDDVLSELDLEKREALIKFLNQVNSQIFITTTDLNISNHFSDRETVSFKIQSGNILERLML